MSELRAPDGPECTCPLIDVSQFGNEFEFVRGDPTSCPRHSDKQRAAKRAEAVYRARYGDEALEQARKPVLLDVSRDQQRHPRDETGRYVPEGETGQFIERGDRG